MPRRLVLPLAILAGCAGAPTPPPRAPAAPHGSEIAALREAVLGSSQALDLVRSLTDEAGPRLAGSAGDRAAVAWAQRALAAAGLSRVHVEPVRVPHWERGEERAAILSPTPQPLSFTALGGSVGTPAGGLEAEVVELASLEALEAAAPQSLAGKIAFVHTRMERSADGSGYAPAAAPRSRGAVAAAKKGAVALLIRSVGTDDHRRPHTGGMRYDDAVPKIPAAALAAPDADLVHRRLAAGQRVRVRLDLGARTLPDAESHNVIGDLVGSAAPEEIVLLAAHLDSWDLGRGALDDAAGCAIILEAARQIGKLGRRPRRTLRIALFANEENGLRGARAYAEAHAAELGAHVLALEADLGDGRVVEARFLGPAAARPLFLDVAAAAEPLGATLSAEPGHEGADLIPLVAAGVPVIDLRQDAITYFDFHHTADDTLERIRKADLDQATAAFAAVAFAAADATRSFGRIPEGARGHH